MSEAKPWCSIERALSAAPARSVVYLRAGTYPRLDLEGAPRKTGLTVRSYPGERVTVEGALIGKERNIRLERLRITRGVVIGPGARNITIRKNRLDPAGILIEEGSARVLVRDNYVKNPEGSGVHFSATPGEPPIRHVRIRNNHFDNIGVVGVNARHFRNLLIDANEFEGIHSWDGVVHPDVIRTYDGGTKLVVRRNFIHDNAAQGFFIKDGTVHNVLFENNVIVRMKGAFQAVNIYDVERIKLLNNTILDTAVFQGEATGVVLKNNIFNVLAVTSDDTTFAYNDHNMAMKDSFGLPQGAHDVLRTPRFRSQFRLAPGSPGIDAGTSVGAPKRDRLGRRRVDVRGVPNRGTGPERFFDLGAHEFVPKRNKRG